MQSSINNNSWLMTFVAPKQIVVATDLTDTAILLPHAIAQAKVSNSHVTLVHALCPYHSGSPCESSYLLKKESDARRMLMGAVHEMESAGVECSIVVQCGLSQDVIFKEMRRIDATRLIMGTHGHGSCGPMMLGSVTNAILTTVTMPTFVVGPRALRPPSNSAPHKILHSVSLKGDYRQHARLAMELANACNAELTFLHVLPQYLYKSSYTGQLLSQTKASLSELIPSDVSPKLAVHTIVACGDVIEETVKASVAIGADWIVLGIERDCSFWSHNNNAAYKVLAKAACPVLALRGHLHDAQDERTGHIERVLDVNDSHTAAL